MEFIQQLLTLFLKNKLNFMKKVELLVLDYSRSVLRQGLGYILNLSSPLVYVSDKEFHKM